jgi:flagellar assembly protein FliH
VQAFEYPAVLTKGRVAVARKNEEDAALEAQAREQALRDLESRWQQECERRVTEERAQLKQAIDGFASECDQYYRRVEAEVVQLSLAIARRILHREAETDQLMLAGVVRVALDNLRAATDLKLHVCPTHAQAWRELFGKAGGKYQLTVLDEPLFEPSQVRLESSLGMVELGVDEQLKEIEHGFFDLLAAKPR